MTKEIDIRRMIVNKRETVEEKVAFCDLVNLQCKGVKLFEDKDIFVECGLADEEAVRSLRQSDAYAEAYKHHISPNAYLYEKARRGLEVMLDSITTDKDLANFERLWRVVVR